ncbi:MAG TPA: hypothetical protein VF711_04475 [Acidimicrobiales bacterium]|jgi:hypothetical protein
MYTNHEGLAHNSQLSARALAVRSITQRERVALTAMVLAIFATVIGAFGMVSAQRATADVLSNGACSGAFNGSPEGTLAKQTVPAPDSVVAPGTTVQVTITWDTGDWDYVDQLFDCVQVAGAQDDSLSFEEKPATNDGVATHSYTIPADAAHGSKVCDRARLSGKPTGEVSTQKSNVVCFVVDPTGSTEEQPPPGEPPADEPPTAEELPADDPPTAEEPPTTAPVPTTVPSDGPTTSPPATPPSVQPTASPSPDGSPDTGPSAQVLGEVTRRGTLAQTGSGSIALLAVGLVVFNLGATLLVASRKSAEAVA